MSSAEIFTQSAVRYGKQLWSVACADSARRRLMVLPEPIVWVHV